MSNAERNITRDYDKGVETETTPIRLVAPQGTVEINGVAYPCAIVAVESFEMRALPRDEIK